MKKTIALLLALCLAAAMLVGCGAADTASDETDEGVEASAAPADGTDTAEPEATSEPVEYKTVDFAALYESRDADEVVATLDGHDITWQEFYYWLYMQASQMQTYFTQMATIYGQEYSWADDLGDGSGETFSDLAVDNAGFMLCQLYGIESYAEENKIRLTAADEAAIAAQLESNIAAICGEGATEDDFNEKLAETYLDRELYDRLNRVDKIYNNGLIAKYGENGSKVSDEDAVKYLEDNGYLAASHILLMTQDPATREALSEDEIAEKKAQAEKIAEELGAIDDEKKLLARFAELKTEYDEDTGKVYYPDGYVFTEGTMVTEFEDAVKSLKAGEVSGVVESSYGYHIILRLAHDADRTVSYSSDGSEKYTARFMCASQKYSDEMESYVTEFKLDYVDGFKVDISEFESTVTE